MHYECKLIGHASYHTIYSSMAPAAIIPVVPDFFILIPTYHKSRIIENGAGTSRILTFGLKGETRYIEGFPLSPVRANAAGASRRGNSGALARFSIIPILSVVLFLPPPSLLAVAMLAFL